MPYVIVVIDEFADLMLRPRTMPSGNCAAWPKWARQPAFTW